MLDLGEDRSRVCQGQTTLMRVSRFGSPKMNDLGSDWVQKCPNGVQIGSDNVPNSYEWVTEHRIRCGLGRGCFFGGVLGVCFFFGFFLWVKGGGEWRGEGGIKGYCFLCVFFVSWWVLLGGVGFWERSFGELFEGSFRKVLGGFF